MLKRLAAARTALNFYYYILRDKMKCEAQLKCQVPFENLNSTKLK